jgi:acetylornithine deacetylase/succinyl-diaminopimelate desuccinylase-like protein
VAGEDSTDDFPYSGHNATLALGHLATSLAERLDDRLGDLPVKACLAGIHTGNAHNRVFGTGCLLVNFTYTDAAAAAVLRRDVHAIVEEAAATFRSRYGTGLLGARLARDWPGVVRTRWLKAGLPTLDNRDADMELVLSHAGLVRDDRDATNVFTCDAIWCAAAGRYVVVCGPGDLDADGAHTAAEHVGLDQLRDYAARVADLVRAFAEHVAAGTGEEPCA